MVLPSSRSNCPRYVELQPSTSWSHRQTNFSWWNFRLGLIHEAAARQADQIEAGDCRPHVQLVDPEDVVVALSEHRRRISGRRR